MARYLLILVFLILAAPAHRASGAELPSPESDEAIDAAIDEAKAFLWSQWDAKEGYWRKAERGKRGSDRDGPEGPNFGGWSALALYALLATGESAEDFRVQKSLFWLSQVPIHGVYARSVRACVWGELGPNSRYISNLRQDVDWLVKAMYYRNPKRSDGSYPYLGPRKRQSPGASSGRRSSRRRAVRRLDEEVDDRGNWDNSNSNMALLGVWAGARCGVEVPMQYWRLAEGHWTRDQQSHGGWFYRTRRKDGKITVEENRGSGSMTAAGVASLFICMDNLHRASFTGCRSVTDSPAIAKGLKWLEENFDAGVNVCLTKKSNPRFDGYYLYTIERVGLAGGRRYFGDKNWYRQGARVVVKWLREEARKTEKYRRRKRGQYPRSVVDTSFALLFLARGRQPVLFNKLHYDGMWNSRPRDLANLSRWVSQTFENHLNWQIVPIRAPLTEWHDSPILYISGASAPKLTDAHIADLRTFVQQGGTILSETACNRKVFDAAMRKIYAKMFPEYELKLLKKDHPIYNLHFKKVQAGPLWCISNGVRLMVLHSPRDLSKVWQLNQFDAKKRSAPFRLAANLYMYVTDKSNRRRRQSFYWPKADPSRAPEHTVKLAVVKHAGRWNVEPLAWQRFVAMMADRHATAVELSEPMELTALDATAWPAAAMTGTRALRLNAGDREAILSYVNAGGTLIIDAAGGSDEFAKAMREQINTLLPGARLRLLAPSSKLYA
ncbi:MAG: DUF4159 domain-containing protein, partial [Planctomycetes bacterium]|nr:DUF4159 domain-containing protein [Planctomycetota bacterium]